MHNVLFDYSLPHGQHPWVAYDFIATQLHMIETDTHGMPSIGIRVAIFN